MILLQTLITVTTPRWNQLIYDIVPCEDLSFIRIFSQRRVHVRRDPTKKRSPALTHFQGIQKLQPEIIVFRRSRRMPMLLGERHLNARKWVTPDAEVCFESTSGCRQQCSQFSPIHGLSKTVQVTQSHQFARPSHKEPPMPQGSNICG